MTRAGAALLPGLTRPGAAQPVVSPATDYQSVLSALRRAGFVEIADTRGDTTVRRFRLANATSLGYPGALSVFVPEGFSRAAPLHLHLHGFILSGMGNLETQVFQRTDKHDLRRMLMESGTQGMLVMPESPGNNTLFNREWNSEGGAERFETFTTHLARAFIGADRFASASLSTHSGSGLLGDRIVLRPGFGTDVVRYRGHFDDGYGTRDWPVRFRADAAMRARGGYVLSLARAPGVDGIGEGSNHMNAAAYHERTGATPTFEHTSHGTFVRADQRLPTISMNDLTITPTEQMTRFNVTTRNHWEPKNALGIFWGFGNPAR